MKELVNGLLVAMFMYTTSAVASDVHVDDSWQLKRDKQDVKIYTRAVKGSAYKEVMGATFINTRLSSLVALIQDTKACPEWADLCKRSTIHESISATEHYIYTLNDLPWPVTSRDVLSHVTWQQNPVNLQVIMHSQATSGLLEENKGIVRLTEAKASWTFTPLANGVIEITTVAHINPAGPLPGWMTNLFLIDSPFKTLVNLKHAVNQSKYPHASVSFIREPKQ
jgi:hypothetical protein